MGSRPGTTPCLIPDMSTKTLAARWLARGARRHFPISRDRALRHQGRIAKAIAQVAAKTVFGRDHYFSELRQGSDYAQAIPLRDYEGLRPWLDRVAGGERDICWPGRPIYLAKTSGTTSGAKYIPITRDSIGHHIEAARQVLYTYIVETGDSDWVHHRMLFLSGSPVLERHCGIKTGRLSGIVNHHIPAYLQRNKMPSRETNCMEDWEAKVEQVVEECLSSSLGLVSGIPPWVQMFFERLRHKAGMPVARRFPELKLYVHGGVNFAPYRKPLEDLLGPDHGVTFLETYPASEGFIAYQDSLETPGLLLNTNAGMFFEFVPVEDLEQPEPRRLTLAEVEVGVHYALVLHTNAGLWGYLIGDTVRFLSLDPFRLVVSGRTKHYTSAFGEHVIAEEVDGALTEALEQVPASVREFHVAPVVNPSQGLPHHQWLVEFATPPDDRQAFARALDEAMQKRNPYYKDLVGKQGILEPLRLQLLPTGSFNRYMQSQGRLGGQNKPARLANHRRIADALLEKHSQG